MEIFVVDLETTGLKGYPDDYVVEIAVMKVDLQKNRIEQIYQSLIHYDVENWDEDLRNSWIFQNTDITLQKIQETEKDSETVVLEIRRILQNRYVTSFNIMFDFDKFLKHEIWNINERKCNIKFAPCIMISASEYLKLSFKDNKIKLVSLHNAKRNIVSKKSSILKNNHKLALKIEEQGFHRASYDTFYASCILLELWIRGEYDFTPKIYYSHSMQIYGTRQEKQELKIINNIYGKSTIINPSEYTKEWENKPRKEIMIECKNFIHSSDIVVFSAVEVEGRYFVGKGVFDEVRLAEKLKKQVYYISRKELSKYYKLKLYNDDDWNLQFGVVKVYS